MLAKLFLVIALSCGIPYATVKTEVEARGGEVVEIEENRYSEVTAEIGMAPSKGQRLIMVSVPGKVADTTEEAIVLLSTGDCVLSWLRISREQFERFSRAK